MPMFSTLRGFLSSSGGLLYSDFTLSTLVFAATAGESAAGVGLAVYDTNLSYLTYEDDTLGPDMQGAIVSNLSGTPSIGTDLQIENGNVADLCTIELTTTSVATFYIDTDGTVDLSFRTVQNLNTTPALLAGKTDIETGGVNVNQTGDYAARLSDTTAIVVYSGGNDLCYKVLSALDNASPTVGAKKIAITPSGSYDHPVVTALSATTALIVYYDNALSAFRGIVLTSLDGTPAAGTPFTVTTDDTINTAMYTITMISSSRAVFFYTAATLSIKGVSIKNLDATPSALTPNTIVSSLPSSNINGMSARYMGRDDVILAYTPNVNGWVAYVNNVSVKPKFHFKKQFSSGTPSGTRCRKVNTTKAVIGFIDQADSDKPKVITAELTV